MGVSQSTRLILFEFSHILRGRKDALGAFELSQAIIELSNTGSCIRRYSVLDEDGKSDGLDETTQDSALAGRATVGPVTPLGGAAVTCRGCGC